jgi:hypothetical protein
VRLAFIDSVAVLFAPSALLNQYHLSGVIPAVVLKITATINPIRAFGRNQISVQVTGFGFQDLGFADT